jgi:hypothetical protein
VGSLALLLAALLALGLLPRWQAEQRRAEQALQQRARTVPAPVPPPSRATADQRLAVALPPADAAPQRIAALAERARQLGVTLDSVRQSAPERLGKAAAALPAERVPLHMAGSASYDAWRRFVAEALQQDDALLLEQLQLSRAGPQLALLAAELRWSLLQGSGTDAGEPAPLPLPVASRAAKAAAAGGPP